VSNPLAGGQFAVRTIKEHEENSSMFARIVEFTPRQENREEIVKVIRREILPVLKSQPGFLEILPFVPETRTEKLITVTLWAEKRDAERYEREIYPKVEGILKPYLATSVTCKQYHVETSVCKHFSAALTSDA
jgi:quinol monooxygenase YgiN